MHYSPILYLDPGSGSMLIQLVIAALLGIGVFIRSQWARIKTLFGNSSSEKNDALEDKLKEFSYYIDKNQKHESLNQAIGVIQTCEKISSIIEG